VLGRIAQREEQTDKAEALLEKLPATHADGEAARKELEAGRGNSGQGQVRARPVAGLLFAVAMAGSGPAM
jgi:hypothetical protein